MRYLRVEITRYVEAYQPGIVECAFTDADGHQRKFVVKAPYVTAENLWWDSPYPRPGSIECDKVEEVQTTDGRDLARIVITAGESLDSVLDDLQFVVLKSQLSDE